MSNKKSNYEFSHLYDTLKQYYSTLSFPELQRKWKQIYDHRRKSPVAENMDTMIWDIMDEIRKERTKEILIA